MKRLLALAAVLTLVPLVFSDPARAGCNVVRRATVVRQAAVVVDTPAVAVVAAPVVVAQVAAYSASYQPASAAACAEAPSAADVVKELRALRAEVAALRAGPAPAAARAEASASAASDAGSLKFAAKCAACHDAAVSAKKGGNVTFFSGGAETDFGCDLALRAVGAIADGSMPKGGKLEGDDGPDLLTHLAKRAKH
jgi:hypothetical protein